MPSPTPHYLLLTEGGCPDSQSRWRFVLQGIDSPSALAASDTEPLADPERADLLAVVRGLEAIEQPARVTLITRSRYVQQGLARGLQEWRENGWQWERFGRLVPVRDFDLWQRVDQALAFHQVDCRCWRFDEAEGQPNRSAHPAPAGPHFIRCRTIRNHTAAESSATNENNVQPQRDRPSAPRSGRPGRPRWAASTLHGICTSAARAVSAPLAASSI